MSKLESVTHRNIYNGDVMDRLSEFPDSSVDCIITSPPYWALRDYSIDGQWGLEKTPKEYLSKMAGFMEQLKRILKDTGTCWINLGDTYSTGVHNIQAKSRMGVTEQFYLNCIKSGWIARNVIPWIKWNAMPQSVKDRFTNKWEYIYFFAKSQKYYFNLDAVRIQTQNDWESFSIHVRDHHNGKAQMKFGDMTNRRVLSKNELDKVDTIYNKDGTKKIAEKYTDENSNVARLHKDRNYDRNDTIPKQDATLGSDGSPKKTYAGFNDRYNESQNNKGKNPGDLTFEMIKNGTYKSVFY